MSNGWGEGGLIDGVAALQSECVEELAVFYRQASSKLAKWTAALGAASALLDYASASLVWVAPAVIGVFTGGMSVAAEGGAAQARFQVRRIRQASHIATNRNRPPLPFSEGRMQ